MYQGRHLLTGVELITQQSKVITSAGDYVSNFIRFVILDILEESYLYKHIKEIVPLIGYNSCYEKEKCTDIVRVQPTDLYITFAYPFMKFTISFPNIKSGGSFYTYAFFLKKNIPCRLLLEDKERFTRRYIMWKKEITIYDDADFEFAGKNESHVYEFLLSIR